MDNVFISLPYEFIEEKSSKYLYYKELYLYSFLSTLSNCERVIYTNVDLIEQIIPVKFYSREKESKQIIRGLLIDLFKKGIIEINKSKFNNNTAIEIRIINIGNISNCVNISYDKFRKFEDMIEFYIYYIVLNRNSLSKDDNGFKSTYKEWSRLLNCSERTARKKIEKCIEKNIIYRDTVGDEIIYKLVPFNKIKK